MPQGREQAEAQIRKLESRRKALQRHRQVADVLYMGGSKEHDARLKANTTAMDDIDRQITELQSGQGRMRQRQQTLAELKGSP
jgi:hypothetical protein